MDRMIYLSMSGAKAAMQRQDVLANNLANVSTVGFRAELAAFRAVPVQGSGASTRVYALESTPGYDDSPGVVSTTGRPLDVAMRGNAWLAVQDACGGIDPDDLPKVFDVALRGASARTPHAPHGGGQETGAGLGLAIARGLVQAHGGQISVRNQGHGCRFEVRLPVSAAK